jgi:hypothetical protein
LDIYEEAAAQVIACSLPGFEKKADAVRYFKKNYPEKASKGKPSWKQELISNLLPFTPQTGKDPKKNLSKRFDPQRLETREAKNDKQYQNLSKSLGLIKPPLNGYHVHYDGGIQFSECEVREFDVDVTGQMARDVARRPDRIVDLAIQIYMQEEGEDEGSIPGPCADEGAPKITVTANPDDYKIPPAPKKHKSSTPFFKRGKGTTIVI